MTNIALMPLCHEGAVRAVLPVRQFVWTSAEEGRDRFEGAGSLHCVRAKMARLTMESLVSAADATFISDL